MFWAPSEMLKIKSPSQDYAIFEDVMLLLGEGFMPKGGANHTMQQTGSRTLPSSARETGLLPRWLYVLPSAGLEPAEPSAAPPCQDSRGRQDL